MVSVEALNLTLIVKELVVLKRTEFVDFTTFGLGMIGELNDAVCHWDFMHGQAFVIF